MAIPAVYSKLPAPMRQTCTQELSMEVKYPGLSGAFMIVNSLSLRNWVPLQMNM